LKTMGVTNRPSHTEVQVAHGLTEAADREVTDYRESPHGVSAFEAIGEGMPSSARIEFLL
jgi:hypothetical protein